MNHYFTDGNSKQLRPRELLTTADSQALWMLESGALRIDMSESDDASCFVRMALPGDVIGVESLVGTTERTLVRALTSSRLVPVTLFDEGHLKRMLMEAVAKGYQRCCEVATLRTGPTDNRVKRLLLLLANQEVGKTGEAVACALPSLNDMAAMVNAAPETVCRALANLRQVNFRK